MLFLSSRPSLLAFLGFDCKLSINEELPGLGGGKYILFGGAKLEDLSIADVWVKGFEDLSIEGFPWHETLDVNLTEARISFNLQACGRITAEFGDVKANSLRIYSSAIDTMFG